MTIATDFMNAYTNIEVVQTDSKHARFLNIISRMQECKSFENVHFILKQAEEIIISQEAKINSFINGKCEDTK